MFSDGHGSLYVCWGDGACFSDAVSSNQHQHASHLMVSNHVSNGKHHCPAQCVTTKKKKVLIFDSSVHRAAKQGGLFCPVGVSIRENTSGGLSRVMAHFRALLAPSLLVVAPNCVGSVRRPRCPAPSCGLPPWFQCWPPFTTAPLPLRDTSCTVQSQGTIGVRRTHWYRQRYCAASDCLLPSVNPFRTAPKGPACAALSLDAGRFDQSH